MGFFSGALLTANIVSGWISSARTKKDIKKIYEKTTDANYKSRAVLALPHIDKTRLLLTSGGSEDNDIYVYETKSTTPALDYIWSESNNTESVIVSGGKANERTRALMPFVNKAQQHDGIPLVVLHTGNRDLETLINSHSVVCELVSRGNLYYDAFRSLPIEDMAFLLYETMPDEDASPNAEALIRSLLEILLRTDGKVTFQNLAAFPLANIMDKLNALKFADEVTADEFSNISRDYMAGSSEIDAVRSFLNKLNRQADNVYGKATSNTCNIKKILKLKGVIAFDVGAGSNDLVLSFLINQLLYYQSAGRDFALLFEGIPFSKLSILRDLLRGKTFAISHNDFISSLHGGEGKGDDMFTEITGDVSTVVLFSHKSGTSCQKWSEHLGKYHKIKIRMNISRTSSFLTGGNTQGISVDETDEPRIRAETISMLPDSLACIHTKNGTLLAEV